MMRLVLKLCNSLQSKISLEFVARRGRKQDGIISSIQKLLEKRFALIPCVLNNHTIPLELINSKPTTCMTSFQFILEVGYAYSF